MCEGANTHQVLGLLFNQNLFWIISMGKIEKFPKVGGYVPIRRPLLKSPLTKVVIKVTAKRDFNSASGKYIATHHFQCDAVKSFTNLKYYWWDIAMETTAFESLNGWLSAHNSPCFHRDNCSRDLRRMIGYHWLKGYREQLKSVSRHFVRRLWPDTRQRGRENARFCARERSAFTPKTTRSFAPEQNVFSIFVLLLVIHDKFISGKTRLNAGVS